MNGALESSVVSTRLLMYVSLSFYFVLLVILSYVASCKN